ncbi:MAG: type IV pilus modification protein PilV [Gammaproteobacteria bacterium]
MTLIEVLVALLVISVGLLGIAGLQLTSMQANTTAYHHSQAIWYAYDMADRMRVNATGVTTGAYDAVSVDGSEAVVDCSVGCTPATLATYDAYEFGRQVATLPAGEGRVAANGDGTYTVTVMWDELGGQAAVGTGCDPTDPNDKTCVQVTLRP